MYVHVTADGALYYGQPPGTATNGTRSWDLSDRDPARMAAAGWYAVDVSPRPADTDEITNDGEVVVTDGIPTRAWIARPWTESEIATPLPPPRPLPTRTVNRGSSPPEPTTPTRSAPPSHTTARRGRRSLRSACGSPTGYPAGWLKL